MPDLDSGHIFLTTLAPIKDSRTGGKSHLSFGQNVRVALAKLPTAMQSPTTVKTGINSPFARNKRTHLARMFVLDNAVYNGKVKKPALAALTGLLGKNNGETKQKADRLNAPYLVFCAEIDAISEEGAPLPAELSAEEQKHIRADYAKELWRTMDIELQDIYSNCYGFEGVETAEQFAEYLDKCHVETTMPFHDYYLELPDFHVLPYKPLIGAVAVPAAVALIALLARLFGMLSVFGLSTFWIFIAALVITIIVIFLAIRFALKNGEKSLAPAKYDDLPSVLKSLYIQQNLSDFVVGQQGSSAEKLHKDFGTFLKKHKPSDRSAPTQNAGEISSLKAKPKKADLIA